MTQEEKAKRYEQTLERARQFSEHPLMEDSSNVVEYIFPELRESEDELMKKTIIHALRGDVILNKKQATRAIAWLEKQKPIIAENEKWLIDETLYFLDEFQQSDRCYSENEMQNSITCKNWLKSLKERMGG